MAREGGTNGAADAAADVLVILGITGDLARGIAVAWVDRFARRPPLLSGLVGRASVSQRSACRSWRSRTSRRGPIVWTLISEIHPQPRPWSRDLGRFVLAWRLVPETKGRSLEEIQGRWVVGGDRMLDEETA